ncbi:MAG: hypothetical protein HY660_07415 [Armatimonadetes bacterium]|nr:hypothetical protein [Armatimonadota bacterium]
MGGAGRVIRVVLGIVLPGLVATGRIAGARTAIAAIVLVTDSPTAASCTGGCASPPTRPGAEAATILWTGGLHP